MRVIFSKKYIKYTLSFLATVCVFVGITIYSCSVPDTTSEAVISSEGSEDISVVVPDSNADGANELIDAILEVQEVQEVQDVELDNQDMVEPVHE